MLQEGDTQRGGAVHSGEPKVCEPKQAVAGHWCSTRRAKGQLAMSQHPHSQAKGVHRADQGVEQPGVPGLVGLQDRAKNMLINACGSTTQWSKEQAAELSRLGPYCGLPVRCM